MADLPALRAALTRMGFSAASAQHVTDQQELNTLDEFGLLDDDEVVNSCKVVRRPGGTIPNPDAGDPGQPNDIPNPGLNVTLRAENNLKLMCYFVRFKHRTSRDVAPAEITLNSVQQYRAHKEWEDKHEDVDAPEINTKDWPRTIDSVEEHLRGCLGATKIPLACVIREDQGVPAADPANGCASLQDELIARAPIQDPDPNIEHTPAHLADRSRVWELVSDLTREMDCWTHVRPAQRTRDGRMAFHGLKQHYLGANMVDNMSARLEHKLRTATCSGEKRRWNFEKHVKTQEDQFAIAKSLEALGHAGIDDRSKVRHLTTGIKTAALDSVKTRIMSDATLRNDCQACVNLFQDFIQQRSSNELKESAISALHTDTSANGGNKRDRGDRKPSDMEKYKDVQPDMSVEDRCYTFKEHKELLLAKQHGLALKRQKRGHKPGTKTSATRTKNNNLTLSKASIEAIAAAVTEEQDSSDSDSSDSDSDDDEIKPPEKKKQKTASNRNNKALQRKK